MAFYVHTTYVHTTVLVAGLGLALTLMGCASTAPSAPPERATEYDSRTHDATAQKLETAAARWIGTPYQYGGTSSRGIDCSGLLQVLYAEALDMRLPRTTDEQKRLGTIVAAEAWQPGDLVFFDTPGKAQHAGIYLQGGRFVHASTSQGVMVSSMSAPYWQRTYEQSRRLLPHRSAVSATAAPAGPSGNQQLGW